MYVLTDCSFFLNEFQAEIKANNEQCPPVAGNNNNSGINSIQTDVIPSIFSDKTAKKLKVLSLLYLLMCHLNSRPVCSVFNKNPYLYRCNVFSLSHFHLPCCVLLAHRSQGGRTYELCSQDTGEAFKFFSWTIFKLQLVDQSLCYRNFFTYCS